ncbi:MAG: biotin/lipoyl-containing protein [Gemmatimonadales bacterium]
MKYIVTVAGREFEVEVDGEQVTVAGRTHTANLSAAGPPPLQQLLVDGRPLPLALERAGRGVWKITSRGERWDAEVRDERTRHIRALTGTAEKHRGPEVLRAPMPGLVVRIQAVPGQEVAAGAGLVVLEAMKMENELKASAPGVIRAVHVRTGEAVEKGQALVEFV